MSKIPKMQDVIAETCCGEDERKLFRAVMRQLGPDWSEVYERPEDFRDASAGVPGFITYAETEPFAKRNIEEILNVVAEFEADCGTLEKDKCGSILNWYAWFALENTIQKIMDYKEQEDG